MIITIDKNQTLSLNYENNKIIINPKSDDLDEYDGIIFTNKKSLNLDIVKKYPNKCYIPKTLSLSGVQTNTYGCSAFFNIGLFTLMPISMIGSDGMYSKALKIIGDTTILYSPDVIQFDNDTKALSDVDIWIANPTSVNKSVIKRYNSTFVGHMSVISELQKCQIFDIKMLILPNPTDEVKNGIENLESRTKVVLVSDKVEINTVTTKQEKDKIINTALILPMSDKVSNDKFDIVADLPDNVVGSKVYLIVDNILIGKGIILASHELEEPNPDFIFMDSDATRFFEVVKTVDYTPIIVSNKLIGKMVNIESLDLKSFNKISNAEILKLHSLAHKLRNITMHIISTDLMKKRNLFHIKMDDFDEFLIKDIKTYNPEKQTDEQLRDDWRLLSAYYCSKKYGIKISYSNEELISTGVKIIKELIKRNAVVFHPKDMKSCSREFFNIVVSKLKNKPKIENEFSVSSITVERVKHLTDEQLIDLYKTLHNRYKVLKKDIPLEKWVNANVIVVKEIMNRGLMYDKIEDVVTQVTDFILVEYPNPPKQENEQDEKMIFIDDVLTALPSVINVSQEPFVFLTGSIVNKGYVNSDSDIDILIRSETYNEAIEKAILDNLPDEIANKVNFMWSKDEPKIGFSLPLYKHTLSRTSVLSQDKIDLNTFVKYLKPKNDLNKNVFFDEKSLWENFAKKFISKGEKLAVEEKVDGMRFMIYWDKKKNSLRFISEDRHRNRVNVMNVVPKEFIEKIGSKYDSLILDGEWIDRECLDLKKCDKLPREDMIKWITSEEPMDDSNVIFYVYDILFINGKDVHNLPYCERRKLYEQVIPKDCKHFKIVDGFIVDNVVQFFKALHKVRKMAGSEGAVIKTCDSKYVLTGRTNLWAKIKNVKSIDYIVLGKRKIEGSKQTYQYQVGVFLPNNRVKEFDSEHIKELNGKKYLVIGTTYNTNINASIGDILEVNVMRIRRYINNKTGKPYLTHMFPVPIRKRTDKNIPDSVVIAEKIEKVGTGMLSKDVIKIPLKMCPYYDDETKCPIKANPAFVYNEVWKQTLKIPIKCKYASIFRCPYVKDYYYKWERIDDE